MLPFKQQSSPYREIGVSPFAVTASIIPYPDHGRITKAGDGCVRTTTLKNSPVTIPRMHTTPSNKALPNQRRISTADVCNRLSGDFAALCRGGHGHSQLALISGLAIDDASPSVVS